MLRTLDCFTMGWNFIKTKDLLKILQCDLTSPNWYLKKKNPKAEFRIIWEETFYGRELRKAGSSCLKKVPHFSNVFCPMYWSIRKSVGWRSELLFGLGHVVTSLQVWGGEVITKHLYFRMDLEPGWGPVSNLCLSVKRNVNCHTGHQNKAS